ncbi:MAG TPA: hypothetical protein DCY35_04730 [Prolixibacteraceae bacterium]|nr:hypothetical protein [Prolixibacteraceae bacterium]
MKSVWLRITAGLLVMLVVGTVMTSCRKSGKIGNPTGSQVKTSTMKNTTKFATQVTTRSVVKTDTVTVSTDGQIDNGNSEVETSGDKKDQENEYMYDFGGRTIILESAARDLPYLLDYVDFSSFDRYDQNGVYLKGFSTLDDLTYDHWREVERKLNCKIRVKFSGSWGATPPRMEQEILAGTYKFSMCFPNSLLANWAKFGIIVPIDDYVDFDGLESLNQPIVKEMSSWQGKYYTVNNNLPTLNLHAVQYNMDMRDRDALPDLMELYKKGQWTWDKLLEIAVTATRDLNGDGINDVFGVGFSRMDWAGSNFIQANGVPVIEYKDGQYVHNTSSPAFMRAMTFLSDLVNVYKVRTTQNDYQAGKAYMFLGGQFGYHTNLFYQNGRIRSLFVPTPLGPDNTEGKLVVSMKKFGWWIPSTEKDPKGIAYLMVNLFQTNWDPERPDVSYDQMVTDATNRLNMYWPGLGDNRDMVDLWLNMNSEKLMSTTKVELVDNGFDNIKTILSQILNQIATYTPIAQIIESVTTKIDEMLRSYN